ncbi:MAG: polynucleotide adenylyltransferase PcnB, partial [Xanthomonadaceae bacterium]|nr:polynucleotide adenylyltransferase PcnB [Xanthomonadaceae bacterium]
RFSTMAKEIWMFQPRFERRKGKRAMRLLNERRFRAAYDFLLLRADEEPEIAELATWWTEIQQVDPKTREDIIFGKRNKPATRTRPVS